MSRSLSPNHDDPRKRVDVLSGAHALIRSRGIRQRVLVCLAATLSLPSIALDTQTSEPPTSQAARPSAPAQPIPFSHGLHCQLLQHCSDCHRVSGWDMTYPPESRCMQCHATIGAGNPAIKKLAQYDQEHTPVPWVQIYKVPDFVFFSHKAHYEQAKISCETCHGVVTERDVITKEKPTSMATCMECHRTRHVSVSCNYCHNPNP